MKMKALSGRISLTSGLRFAAACSLSVVMAGCAVLMPSSPPSTYDLIVPQNLQKAQQSRAILVVAEPIAIQAINSERIVARTSSGQVTYIPDAQWADRLPALLQARIVQTLENSGRLVSVGRPGERLAAQNVLMTEIRAFEITDRGGASFARIELSAKIVRDASGHILTAKVFTAEIPVSDVNGGAASQGLNRALADVLTQLSQWIHAR